MKALRTILIATVVVAAPQALSAQSAAPIAPQASVLFHVPMPSATSRPAATMGSGHGIPGAVIGGAALGIAGAVVGHGLCDKGDSCTGSTLGYAAVGAVVGAVVGALIGSRID